MRISGGDRPTVERAHLLERVSDALKGRRLIFFGTRGEDAEAVTDLPELVASYSLVGRLTSRGTIESCALEDLTKVRPDLDLFDIDDHLGTPEVGELRAALLRSLARKSALFTYRPTTFLSAISFARQDRCQYLGMFSGHQAAFEHKPWLESVLGERGGIERIHWRYVADLDQLDVRREVERGPVMLRRSRTTGGVGLVRVVDPDELLDAWPKEKEAYVSVAPFLEGAVPVNVGAVVWRDGTTLHPASVQLIGIPECTSRPFGFCGNDFGAARGLGRTALERVETATLEVADALRDLGYLGAFGVDFLVTDDLPIFTEVNPRFQGSTHLSCRFSIEHDRSCLMLDHLAAFLGVPCPATRDRLVDLAAEVGDLAHFVAHHDGAREHIDPLPLLRRVRSQEGYCHDDVRACPELAAEQGATVARITVRAPVTDTGFELLDPWRQALSS